MSPRCVTAMPLQCSEAQIRIHTSDATEEDHHTYGCHHATGSEPYRPISYQPQSATYLTSDTKHTNRVDNKSQSCGMLPFANKQPSSSQLLRRTFPPFPIPLRNPWDGTPGTATAPHPYQLRTTSAMCVNSNIDLGDEPTA